MSDNFGTGVSRVLNPKDSGVLSLIWQAGRPPLDSELNLIHQLEVDATQKLVLENTPSGWLGNDTNLSKSYVTDPSWSNWFKFGQQGTGEVRSFPWAVVNGWLIPITGTGVGTPPGSPNNTDTFNKIALDPPPANSGDFRADFVFVEVWKARLPANPSALNKPSASAIYRYGNVEGGASYLPDDFKDPAIGTETTQRIQLQYRIRVVKGLIGLATFPDGFDTSLVKAQGTQATAPTSGGYPFLNMGKELGDPGLWRAGDGTDNSLATVDGYVYAIPLCVIFRRNSVVWSSDPSQNLNGGFNRNPTATDRSGVTTFSVVPVIATGITDTSTTISVVSVLGSALPTNPASSVLIQIGEEILSYTSITGTTISGVVRGLNGTTAESHPVGSTVNLISGRPDKLFADQVALTDILDLRHIVNPNGFEYQSLLKANLDKLLKGQLRSNWKRSGAGTQGSFVTYEDRISATPAGLGVTSLDAPDRIRQIFSDAAVQQPVEVLCTPYSGVVAVGGSQSVVPTWSLNAVGAVTVRQVTGGTFTSDSVDLVLLNSDPVTGTGDRIVIPVTSFKNTVSGADSDQVRLLNEVPASGSDGVTDGSSELFTTSMDLSGVEVGDTLVIFYGPAKGSYPVVSLGTSQLHLDVIPPATTGTFFEVRKGVGSIQIRVDGSIETLPQHRFVVTPRNPTSTSNLTIQLVGAGAPFPMSNSNRPNLYVTVRAQYGGGRGLSRRPDSIHNITLSNPYAELLTQPSGIPQNNFPLRVSWAMLWSKFRSTAYKNLLPVTAEAYADLGSKTVILTPFQRISFPTVNALNGSGANPTATSYASGSGTLSASTLTATLPLASTPVGDQDLLVIHDGPAKGTYTVQASNTANSVTVYETFPTVSGSVQFSLYHAQGLMPLNKVDGVTPKWSTTDPLNHFSGCTDSDLKRKNFYVTLPRHMVPGWGAVYAPILPANNTTFHRGINFMLQSHEGDYTAVTDQDHNKQYINYTGTFSFAAFSTGNFSGPTTIDATYNATFSYSGTFAGAKFFDDGRGYGRQGIQLPPFYGIARLFAVYESSDYKSNGPGFSNTTRQPTGSGAKNLLRQNFNGPLFWIEIDDDGDSFFVLNADALDLSKSPTPIGSFRSKHYVIAASIFGFDRGSFDINKPFRLVLSRARTSVNSQAIGATRADNITNSTLPGPWAILPGPLTSFDTALVNYSRTPYQGDPWGSQSNYLDQGFTPGPLQSATAYQLSSSFLDAASLTRPNQKPLEVLASIGFITSMGTGRLSGDLVAPNTYDFRNVGFEDPTAYPPPTSIATRPNLKVGALSAAGDTEASPEYLGCTERLPLGALYRDKDFHGGKFSTTSKSPLEYLDKVGVGAGTTSLSTTTNFEQSEISLMPASVTPGTPSDVLVQVDGEPGVYANLTNFRVNRGGSLFVGSGDRPGGEVLASYDTVQGSGNGTKVLVGRAFLVRNAPTAVGANQVSAGDELMLSVVTRVMDLSTTPEDAQVVIGTNGTSEGSAASDLYRIEGHPLVSNRTHYSVDPSKVKLPNRSEGF